MSLTSFVDMVHKLCAKHKDTMRRGQIYIYALNDTSADLADQIRGTGFDPFYNDSRIVMLLLWLKGHWDCSDNK